MPHNMDKRDKPRIFKSVRAVRQYVSKVLNELEMNGEPGDPDRARVQIYAAKTMADLINSVQLEQRIKALEIKYAPPTAKGLTDEEAVQ